MRDATRVRGYRAGPLAMLGAFGGSVESARGRSSATGAWTAVVGWVVVIAWLGGDDFSADDTGGFVAAVVAWLLGEPDPVWIERAHFAVRKAAHLFEYAVLAGLAVRALSRSLDWRTTGIAVASLAIVAAVAVADEARQVGSRQRTGAAADVALDVSGGVIALGFALTRRRTRTVFE